MGEGRESIVAVEDYGVSEREGMEMERKRAHGWFLYMQFFFTFSKFLSNRWIRFM